MGSSQSVRATHFQRPPPAAEPDDEVDDHRISISNKMVERLVEDATLAGGAAAVSGAAPPPRSDHKDKVYMDKLKTLDEIHSERVGLSVEELNGVVARIDLRTANMVSVEPVCADCRERLLQCYSSGCGGDAFKCWDAVGEFTKCVQDAAEARLCARTQRDARELARRSRHVAHAREHALRDLGPPSA